MIKRYSFMAILKKNIIVNIFKISFILYLFFCLNSNAYSIENNDVILQNRLRDMEYFTRLVEFAAGLLVILCTALIVLLMISARKNRLKDRQIRLYEQQQGMALQQDASVVGSKLNTSGIDRASPGNSNESTAGRVESLEKEMDSLRKKLLQEQELRKKMENEVAELLSRIKGA
jgi:hypothetical protein